MFKFSSAKIHYGARSFPLHGLEHEFAEVANAESVNVEALNLAVTRLTSFGGEFKVFHNPRMDFAAICRENGCELPADAVQSYPEHIVAMASGYTIEWIKEE